MIKIEGLLSVVTFALWVFCIIDVIQTPEGAVRNLPKTAWLIIVFLFPLVGSIAWLSVGRPDHAPRKLSAYERSSPAYPEYDRPGRVAATAPDQDDEFLAQVRSRAEAQRKAYDEKRRREQDGPEQR